MTARLDTAGTLDDNAPMSQDASVEVPSTSLAHGSDSEPSTDVRPPPLDVIVPSMRTEAEALRQATALLRSRVASGRVTVAESGLLDLERYASQRERLDAAEQARLAGLLGEDAEQMSLAALRVAVARGLDAPRGGLGEPRIRAALLDGVAARLATLVPDWRAALGLEAAPEPTAAAPTAGLDAPEWAAHDWHARLEVELGRRLGREVHVGGSRRLAGGVSNLVFEIDAIVGGAATRLCLRADNVATQIPGFLPKQHERDLLALVAARGVPCATPLAVVPSPVGKGDAMVDAWLDGETAGRTIVSSPTLAAARARLPAELARALAATHGITRREFPALIPHDPAPLLAGGYNAALAFVAPRGDGCSGFFELEYRAIHAWLRAHRPAEPEARLVHGDVRLGNLMVTPDGLAAVLDWELAHWGDPCRDFAWASLPPLRFGRPQRAFAGLCGLDEFVALYEAHGGPAVDRARLHWWRVLMCRWTIEFVCSDWEVSQAGTPRPWGLPLGIEALLTFEALRLIDARERGEAF